MKRNPEDPKRVRHMLVVKVNAAARKVALIKIEHKPEAILQVVGKRALRGADLGVVNGRMVRIAGDDSADAQGEPRWMILGMEKEDTILHGNAVLFGFEDGRGTSVPVDAKWVEARIHWIDEEEVKLCGAYCTVPAKFLMIRNATGEERWIEYNWHSSGHYQWTDGNFGSDVNRLYFWCDWENTEPYSNITEMAGHDDNSDDAPHFCDTSHFTVVKAVLADGTEFLIDGAAE